MDRPTGSLGACAITGTDRDRSRSPPIFRVFGSDGNTYGSAATVDYLESASATAVLLIGLGRFVQICSSAHPEVGHVRFGDAFVQSSSIMPQKRNPVAIEHARHRQQGAGTDPGGPRQRA